jgi:hypothetical protein
VNSERIDILAKFLVAGKRSRRPIIASLAAAVLAVGFPSGGEDAAADPVSNAGSDDTCIGRKAWGNNSGRCVADFCSTNFSKPRNTWCVCAKGSDRRKRCVQMNSLEEPKGRCSSDTDCKRHEFCIDFGDCGSGARERCVRGCP